MTSLRSWLLAVLLVVAGAVTGFASYSAQEHIEEHGLPRSLLHTGEVLRQLQQRTGLSETAIKQIIARIKTQSPELLQGREIAELRKALASADVNTLTGKTAAGSRAAAATRGSTGAIAAATATVVAGLRTAPGGNLTAAAALSGTGVDAEDSSILDAPEDCTDWSCICRNKPSGSTFPAPDDCQAYITCQADGKGSKVLCDVAGTGFSVEAQGCVPMSAAPPADDPSMCVFEDADSSQGPSLTDVMTTPVLAGENATSSSCEDILQSQPRNIKMAADNDASGLPAGCTLSRVSVPGRFNILASSVTPAPNTTISAVVIKYLEAGTGSVFSVMAVSANGTINQVTQVAPNSSAGVQDANATTLPPVWAPKATYIGFPNFAAAVRVTLMPFPPGAGIRILSLDYVTAPTVEMPVAEALLADIPDDVDPDAGEEVPLPPSSGAQPPSEPAPSVDLPTETDERETDLPASPEPASPQPLLDPGVSPAPDPVADTSSPTPELTDQPASNDTTTSSPQPEPASPQPLLDPGVSPAPGPVADASSPTPELTDQPASNDTTTSSPQPEPASPEPLLDPSVSPAPGPVADASSPTPEVTDQPASNDTVTSSPQPESPASPAPAPDGADSVVKATSAGAIVQIVWTGANWGWTAGSMTHTSLEWFADQHNMAHFMSVYIKAYQAAVVGASQCYRQSYDRGIGTIPTNCGDWSNVGGICYEHCGHAYSTAWFVCWQRCSSFGWEWQDHGVTCHVPMHSYGNRNNGCGWWDVCGLWDRKWCRSCNSGYNRHGCICTRSPQWRTKHSYVRAARLPGCGSREMQDGLCYEPCRTGYWGQAFMCYNHCPDALPYSCGIGLCTRDSATCTKFVVDAVLGPINLAAGVATGSAFSIVTSIASIGYTFGRTRVCSDRSIHLPSNSALIKVDKRDFKGLTLAHLRPLNWDECLVRCKQTAGCQFVVHIHGSDCYLKNQIGYGPDGHNRFSDGFTTGVLPMRLDRHSIAWQFMKFENGVITGAPVVSMTTLVTGIMHNGNIAICQLACASESDCTHIVYNDSYCWVLNRRVPPGDLWKPPAVVHTQVNLAVWNDFDQFGLPGAAEASG